MEYIITHNDNNNDDELKKRKNFYPKINGQYIKVYINKKSYSFFINKTKTLEKFQWYEKIFSGFILLYVIMDWLLFYGKNILLM